MNIYTQVRQAVIAAVAAAQRAGDLPVLDTLPSSIEASPPREAGHGDAATNAAMVLARPMARKPQEIAAVIARHLNDWDSLESAQIAGPGFINLTLKPRVWQEELRAILQAGIGYGDARLGQGEKINVEYVSANPTGPMHIGHTRNACFGDVLANLLTKAGWAVTREYYLNDGGGQVDILARSAYLRYREALGETIGEIPEGLYPGDYLNPVGEALAKRYGPDLRDKPEEVWLPVVRAFAVDQMMALIREDLALLGVKHDVFTSERALIDSGKVQECFDYLQEHGLIYQGVPAAPKGKKIEDWEPVELPMLRATQFGDEVDRPMKKSDGRWVYAAADIAYHRDKFLRGHTWLLTVVGADHAGWVTRIRAGTRAVTDDKARFDAVLYNAVRLFRDGEPVKMSKRSGNFVTLRELVEEVGPDAARFTMLTRRHDQTLDFDFAKVREQSRENPVFYVQYAHARCCSVLRNAAQALPGQPLDDVSLSTAAMGRLVETDELALIRRLAQWPSFVESAAQALEPHRIAFFIYDLAGLLHALWNRGKDDPSLRFLVEQDHDLSLARLALVRATALVLASGLAVLGVHPVEEMRA